MLFPRKILSKIEKHLNFKEIVVLTGMRRVGKTTILKMIFDKIESNNKVFLDIENILDQKIFEEIDYNNIWKNLATYGITNSQKTYIFLDEIQAQPQVIKAIKYLYDHYDVKFFLTGSSSFYLKNLFPESLAGRKIIYELFPLDFEEFLIFKEQSKIFYITFNEKEKNKNIVSTEKFKKYYDEYLKFGGFPQVVLAKDETQKNLYLRDIFTSYFEKDVKVLADFKQISVFRDLIFLLMQRVGSKLEITKLASALNTSRQTIYSYISFLEQTYFINLITPFSNNVDREVSGAKKVYLCDLGLINLFGKVSDGSLLENAVFNNIKIIGKINYYQKRSGAEIDFIIPIEKIALEVKTRAGKSDYVKLSKLAKSLGMNEYYVISKEYVAMKGVVSVFDI